MRSIAWILIIVSLAGCSDGKHPGQDGDWLIPDGSVSLLGPDEAIPLNSTLIVDQVVEGLFWYAQPVASDPSDGPVVRFRTLGVNGFAYIGAPTIIDAERDMFFPDHGRTAHGEDLEDPAGFSAFSHDQKQSPWLVFGIYSEHEATFQLRIELGNSSIHRIAPAVVLPAPVDVSEAVAFQDGVGHMEMGADAGETLLALVARDSGCGSGMIRLDVSGPASIDHHTEVERPGAGEMFWPTSVAIGVRNQGTVAVGVEYHGPSPLLPMHMANFGTALSDWAAAHGWSWSGLAIGHASPDGMGPAGGRCT